jgi:hypothetical protein
MFFWLRRGFHKISAKFELGFLVAHAWLVDPLNLPGTRLIVHWWAHRTNVGTFGLISGKMAGHATGGNHDRHCSE